MAKGLYHCSICKAHFYDAEATAMHIRDKHKGGGEVLRHPTKKELIIRDEQHRARIEELEAKLAKAVEQMQRVKDFRYDPNIGIELNVLEATLAKIKGEADD